MKEIVENNKDRLRTLATDKLQSIFRDNQGKSILFLTSGGSSFDVLKNLAVSNKDVLTVGVLDERYSTDPAINNFSQFTQTDFFKASQDKFKGVLDTTVQEGESQEAFAARMDKMFKDWKKDNPDGIVVATVGMGPDGHVSGIMPHPENEVVFEGLFNNPEVWVVGYDAGDKNQYSERATTTLPFLRDHIDYTVSYITGEGKRDALLRVIQEEGSLAETPARVLRTMKEVSLFTDLVVPFVK